MDHELPRPKPLFDRLHQPRGSAAPPMRTTEGASISLSPELEAQFGPYAGRVSKDGLASRRHYGRANDENDDQVDGSLAPASRDAAAKSDPDADNVVPFKHQSRASATEETADRMPMILSRGRSETAEDTMRAAATGSEPPRADDATAEPAPEPLQPYSAHSNAEPRSSVMVTATERKLSFSLPMNDPRVEGGLYGIADALKRSPAPVPSAAAPHTPVPPAASLTAATAHASASSVPITAGFERSPALALPAPTREHEHRG